MKPLSLRELAGSGVIAAAYAVLTLAFSPISFAVYQVRIAEALTVLPFLSRAAVPGLFIGCMIANAFGMGWQDIVFGSIITLIAAAATRLVALLPDKFVTRSLVLVPVLLLWVLGVIIVGTGSISVLSYSLLIVSFVIVFWLGFRSKNITDDRWGLIAIVVSATSLIIGVASMTPPEDFRVRLAVYAAFAAAWIIGLLALRGAGTPQGVKEALAPLPPVVFNAFGVSLYLAPIMDVDYWIAVQMIGIGEMLACYLLGLPLLRIMAARKLLT